MRFVFLRKGSLQMAWFLEKNFLRLIWQKDEFVVRLQNIMKGYEEKSRQLDMLQRV